MLHPTRSEVSLGLRGVKVEERLSAAERTITSLGRQVAELTGRCRGLIEEFSAQGQPTHSVDERHRRWSRELEADLKGRHDAIEREVRSLSCRASSATSSIVELQTKHDTRLEEVEADVVQEKALSKEMLKAIQVLKENCIASQIQAGAQIASRDSSSPPTEYLGDAASLSLTQWWNQGDLALQNSNDVRASLREHEEQIKELRTHRGITLALQNYNDVRASVQEHEEQIKALCSHRGITLALQNYNDVRASLQEHEEQIKALRSHRDNQKHQCSEFSAELAAVRESALAAQQGVAVVEPVVENLRQDLLEVARQVPEVFQDVRRELREEAADLRSANFSIWEALEAVEPVMEQLRREFQAALAKLGSPRGSPPAAPRPPEQNLQGRAAAAQKGIKGARGALAAITALARGEPVEPVEPVEPAPGLCSPGQLCQLSADELANCQDRGLRPERLFHTAMRAAPQIVDETGIGLREKTHLQPPSEHVDEIISLDDSGGKYLELEAKARALLNYLKCDMQSDELRGLVQEKGQASLPTLLAGPPQRKSTSTSAAVAECL